jgi:hypothetical protein
VPPVVAPGLRKLRFFVALCRCKSFIFNGLNTWLKTGSQEVAGSIPASSTNPTNNLQPFTFDVLRISPHDSPARKLGDIMGKAAMQNCSSLRQISPRP